MFGLASERNCLADYIAGSIPARPTIPSIILRGVTYFSTVVFFISSI